MRRVASVWELKERLDAAYDGWLFRRLETRFAANAQLMSELETLRAQR